MKKRIFSLLVSALYVLGTVFGGLYLFLKPPPPPELKSPAVAHAPLTRHLLLVIVDGLRFDVATDPVLMPRFSLAMQGHRSAEILAGRVSMTSSAVQNYGTGQPGGFEQIARNANPDPARFSNWLSNAAQQGLVLGVMGDDAWVEMYRDSFRFQRRNPPGVAIDYDFNEQSFANGRELLQKSPDFLILHFGTPDHQGHAYGIRSERYRRHIQNYDRLLFELLAEVGPQWTVIVTSDHGAADSGTHGANVLVQRRSPLFAYGPGISSERAASEPLDQADLAGTFAALLGVPAAAHSLGHLLVDWLALPEAERARLACADAERSLSFAQASNLDESRELSERLARVCAPERTPEEAKRGARAVVSEVARLLTLRQGVASPRAVSFVLFSLLGAILLAQLLLEQVPLRSFLPCACMAALAVLLVAGVEHLPGIWPKRADGALFLLAACPLLWFLLRPEQVLAVFNRRIALASALAPGALAFCYPTNLQPMAFALCLSLGIVTLSSRSPGQWGAVIAAGSRAGRLADLLLLAAWGALLVPAGTHADNIYAFSWLADVRVVLPLGSALLGLFGLQLWRTTATTERAALLVALAVAVGSFLLRRAAPPWLGRPALLLLPVLGLRAFRRQQRDAGLLLMLAGLLWVSRDREIVAMIASVGLARLLGKRLRGIESTRWSNARILVVLSCAFALCFVQRAGISGGLDLNSLDWAAGSFGDRNVPGWWVASAVIWKYVLGAGLVCLALLGELPERIAQLLMTGLLVLFLCRTALLFTIILASQGSFWTSMRVFGDLPFSLIGAVAAGALWPMLAARASELNSPPAAAAPSVSA